MHSFAQRRLVCWIVCLFDCGSVHFVTSCLKFEFSATFIPFLCVLSEISVSLHVQLSCSKRGVTSSMVCNYIIPNPSTVYANECTAFIQPFKFLLNTITLTH